jgi:hypothetical protein
LQQAVEASPQAAAVLKELTTTLREKGLLEAHERAVAVIDGKIYKTCGSNSAARLGASPANLSAGAKLFSLRTARKALASTNVLTDSGLRTDDGRVAMTGHEHPSQSARLHEGRECA